MKRNCQPILVIELHDEYDYILTCGGCPTIFEFTDIDGHKLYFRLRWGEWRLFDETDNKTLASGNSDEHDGICDWDEALEMMLEQGVSFEYD